MNEKIIFRYLEEENIVCSLVCVTKIFLTALHVQGGEGAPAEAPAS